MYQQKFNIRGSVHKEIVGKIRLTDLAKPALSCIENFVVINCMLSVREPVKSGSSVGYTYGAELHFGNICAFQVALL